MIEKESWRIIELIIRRYPDKKREYEEYISDIMSSSTGEEYHGSSSDNKPQSVTEAKALKMTSAYMDRLKREIYAVETVYSGLKEEEKKVMRERFWTDRKRNIPYLKMKTVSYSEKQMKRIVFKIICQVGRILGESAALLFTAGFAHAVNGFVDGLASPGASLTVALYVYAKEQGEFGVAFAIAAILMVLTVLINFAATLVQKHFEKRRSV